ncbi:Gamma-glutamylputrescine oxidoreductase [Nocardia otitidiscaviarum]|uniref:Gamma-glutamylputrescine oxidoreductase n=1 Tax=Nocardia otitidiscaviarum TaxID=1823 RepID=A0A379JKP8_9NOCA|nr:Gamma-glutamylputrescine oxidoreductase [Nocardia otitidiscaviarum]
MTSIWLHDARPPTFPPLDPGRRIDTAVVGGGITGLVTALLLAEEGIEVAVLEADRLGGVTTGHTTGKISLLQATRASRIRTVHDDRVLRAYLDANREAKQWLLRYCADHDIPVQTAPAYTYAQTERAVPILRAELEATRKAGLPTEFVTDLDVPFPHCGAVRLDGQAQFDAMDAIAALARDLAARGVPVFEHTRVRGLRREGDRQTLDTEHGDLSAHTVVLATGTPILDRGGFFARLEPQRSYAAAFTVPGDFPTGMYISADAPVRTLRPIPTDRGDLLLVGGTGHGVGRTERARAHADDVVRWTQRHFPGAEPVFRWSAQDYHPIAELPYVGPLLPWNDRVLVATGFAKWGLTNGVAAARALVGRLTGKPPHLGGHLRQLAAARARGCADRHEGQWRCRTPAFLRLAGFRHPRRAAPRRAARRRRGPGGAQRARARRGVHRLRRHPPGVRGLPASGRHSHLERCRDVLGLPAARVALPARRRAAGGPRHPLAARRRRAPRP